MVTSGPHWILRDGLISTRIEHICLIILSHFCYHFFHPSSISWRLSRDVETPYVWFLLERHVKAVSRFCLCLTYLSKSQGGAFATCEPSSTFDCSYSNSGWYFFGLHGAFDIFTGETSFIGGLDCSSKYAHFIPLSHPYKWSLNLGFSLIMSWICMDYPMVRLKMLVRLLKCIFFVSLVISLVNKLIGCPRQDVAIIGDTILKDKLLHLRLFMVTLIKKLITSKKSIVFARPTHWS